MSSADRARDSAGAARPRRQGRESDAAAHEQVLGSAELLRHARRPETIQGRDRGFEFAIDPASVVSAAMFYPGADLHTDVDAPSGVAGAERRLDANPDEPVPDDPTRPQPKDRGYTDDVPP